jgi:hypothetical protein
MVMPNSFDHGNQTKTNHNFISTRSYSLTTKLLFMKKSLFYNASILITMVLVTTFMITSCKKQAADETSTANLDQVANSSVKNKPGTISPVSLRVTVNDASGNKLTSDGGGDYVSGSQAVSAVFDQYGNFIFSCGTSGHGPTATLVRWMNINFDSPIQVFINPPITGNDKVTAITTIPAVGLSFTAIQSLEVGQTECITLTGGSNAEWVMNFHRATEDVASSPSSYMVVTRTSLTQWTMTPVGSCSPNSNVCALRNGPGTLYGYYNMPLSLTLTKL